LVKSIDDSERGIVDANLGGCLVKLRVPRPNEGKSGGFRTIVAYRKGDPWTGIEMSKKYKSDIM